VVGRPTDDHRDVEVGDELLEVQGVALRRHVLGGDDGALDDQQVDTGLQCGGSQPLGVLGRDTHRRRHPAVGHLADPLGDQLRLHRLAVDVLQQGERRSPVARGVTELAEDRLRVLVTGPQALGIEDAEPAGPADGDGGRRADHGVRRAGDQRDAEAEGVDLPGGRDVVDVPGAPGRDDRDLVQVIAPPGEPVQPDLHGLACAHVSDPGSSVLRRSSEYRGGGSPPGPPR
jgi:hypothetical protein